MRVYVLTNITLRPAIITKENAKERETKKKIAYFHRYIEDNIINAPALVRDGGGSGGGCSTIIVIRPRSPGD